MQKRLSEFTKPLPFLFAQFADCHYNVLCVKADYWRRVFEYIVTRYGLEGVVIQSMKELKNFRIGRSK